MVVVVAGVVVDLLPWAAAEAVGEGLVGRSALAAAVEMWEGGFAPFAWVVALIVGDRVALFASVGWVAAGRAVARSALAVVVGVAVLAVPAAVGATAGVLAGPRAGP